jgi:hypothetical protein
VVAVRHDDGAGPRTGHGRRREGAHAAGADDEHGQVADRSEGGLRPGQPGLHERAAHEVDAGLGVHALRDPQGLLEHGVQGWADVTVTLGASERAAHLAEDLGLTDGHRVQARGDVEHVGDSAVLVVHEQVRLQIGPVDRTGVGQRRRDVGQGAVEGQALGVDLGAVARGHDDGFGDVLRAQHRLLEGGAGVGVQGDRLQE